MAEIKFPISNRRVDPKDDKKVVPLVGVLALGTSQYAVAVKDDLSTYVSADLTDWFWQEGGEPTFL